MQLTDREKQYLHHIASSDYVWHRELSVFLALNPDTEANRQRTVEDIIWESSSVLMQLENKGLLASRVRYSANYIRFYQYRITESGRRVDSKLCGN